MAYCPVCEEFLTMGMLERLGLHSAYTRPPLTVEVTTLAPWVSEPRRITVPAPLLKDSGAIIPLEVYRASGGAAPRGTRTRIRVVGAAVPNWIQSLSVGVQPSSNADEVVVAPGQTVRLEVRPGPGEPLDDAALRAVRQTAIFAFEAEPTVSLEAPAGLSQTVAVGHAVALEVDPATGALSVPLTLSARSGGGANLSNDTLMVFEVSDVATGRVVVTERLPEPAPAGVASRLPLVGVPPGKYIWRARTELRDTSLASSWSEVSLGGADCHFEVLTFETGVVTALPRPYGLEVTQWVGPDAGTASTADPLDGLAGRLPRDGDWVMSPIEFGIPADPAIGPGLARGWADVVARAGSGPRVGRRMPDPSAPAPATRMVRLVARAYHPLGSALRFEFQVGVGTTFPVDAPTRTSAPLSPASASTLAVEGDAVRLVPAGEFPWRVRTQDEQGRVSQWVVSDWRLKAHPITDI